MSFNVLPSRIITKEIEVSGRVPPAASSFVSEMLNNSQIITAEKVLCQPYHNYRENNNNECGLKSSIIIEVSGLWTTRKKDVLSKYA